MSDKPRLFYAVDECATCREPLGLFDVVNSRGVCPFCGALSDTGYASTTRRVVKTEPPKARTTLWQRFRRWLP